MIIWLLFKSQKVYKKANLETCTNSKQCCCGQQCFEYQPFNVSISSYKCQCSSDRWWNPSIPYCRNRILNIKKKFFFSNFSKKLQKELRSTYGSSCTDTSQCADVNLVCSNSTCVCSDVNDFYWNGTYCGKFNYAYWNHLYFKRKASGLIHLILTQMYWLINLFSLKLSGLVIYVQL